MESQRYNIQNTLEPILLSIFLLGSAVLSYASRKSLRLPRSHGFFRFFAWEILLVMFLLNLDGWFRNPWAWYQLISWALLVISLVLVVLGLKLLREVGQQDLARNEPSLHGFERTSHLVTVGLYRYIRHPLYSSLLFLAWGMFFKSPSWLDIGLTLLGTIFLIVTARIEEGEDINYFGAAYVEYMQNTRMFIPFVF